MVNILVISSRPAGVHVQAPKQGLRPIFIAISEISGLLLLLSSSTSKKTSSAYVMIPTLEVSSPMSKALATYTKQTPHVKDTRVFDSVGAHFLNEISIIITCINIRACINKYVHYTNL